MEGLSVEGSNLSCALYSPFFMIPSSSFASTVPTGSTSRHEDVAIYVIDINPPSLPTSFYSVLVSVSVFMALSTVFHSINFHHSPLSHSVLPVLCLPFWSFQLHISLFESLPRP